MSGPQWLTDLVEATTEWAYGALRNDPPPCEHNYCREQGYGLCFGVVGAMADVRTRPYTVGPAVLSEGGWHSVGFIRDDGPAFVPGRDILTFDEAYSTPATSMQPEPADIVDQIDELVNDQLANYPNRSGYDRNVNQERCPHCGREWHGLKITVEIETMRALGHYNESYRYADDNSEVLCEGSDFIGPMKHPLQATLNVASAVQGSVQEMIDGVLAAISGYGPTWRELMQTMQPLHAYAEQYANETEAQ